MRNKLPVRHLLLRLFLSISLFLVLPVFFFNQDVCASDGEAHSGELIHGESHENIARGERFFKGLLPFKRDYQSCVSCHNMKPSDTLNWNPSAMAIAVKYLDKDFDSFKLILTEPTGKKMSEVHQNFNIPDEDMECIKSYLDNLAIIGLPHQKPSVNQLLLFFFLGLLITVSLLDLIFFHKIKYRFIPMVIFIASFGYQVKMIAEEGIKLGRSQNYAPDQPIKFSHKVHAGDNGIDCKYCHNTVEYGKSAGIPEMNLCINCHILVREGSHSGKFEISKVIDANEKKMPVEWVRIHNLPDHVFFSHAQHVGVAGLDCKQCHGPVEEMDIMRQHSDLSMGWCVNCHREAKVNFEENGYYDTYIRLHEDLKAGRIDTIHAVDVGANDCMRCHY